MVSKDNYLQWIFCSIRKGIWPPLVLFSIHIIAYVMFDIYDYFISFDIPMHFLGGVCITYFFIQSVFCAKDKGIIGKPSSFFVPLLIFLLTCTTTVFWEFAEWLMDRLLNTTTQVSLDDTMLDMFLGILGGLSILSFYLKKIFHKFKM